VKENGECWLLRGKKEMSALALVDALIDKYPRQLRRSGLPLTLTPV
jgi:hypothetical protein